MKVFISGKITGNANYKAEFQEVADWLERNGHTVVMSTSLPKGLEQKDYFRICLAMIESVDAVVFLPNWINSDGAQLEHAVCDYLGIPVYHL